MTELTMFAIFRAEKIKSWGLLARASSHMNRSLPTPNADPARENLVLIGSGDPANDVRAHLAQAGLVPEGLRKNGVLAVRILATASPEFFRPGRVHRAGEWDADRLDAWLPKTMDFLKTEFGDNLVSVIVHLDESTPHVDAVFVPLDTTPRNKGSSVRLNCARWFDGRKKLVSLQDRYAVALAPLGLTRGVKGSRARHQDIKRQYATLHFEAQQARENSSITLLVLDGALEDRLNAKSEKKAATVERARVKALAFGLEAFADGRIVGASGDAQRPAFMLRKMPPADAQAIKARLKPAWHEVWRALRHLAAKIELHIQKVAERAARRAVSDAQKRLAEALRAARDIHARAERLAKFLTPEAIAEAAVLKSLLKNPLFRAENKRSERVR